MCYVWSISKKQKLYEVGHNERVTHVRLFSDSTLGFDLISSSFDKTIKFWRSGEIVKSLEHSGTCNHFDLDDTNRLLAVACEKSDSFNGGVSLWRLDNFQKITDQVFGSTREVRFNADSTKIIAAKNSGEVYEINLE